MHVDLRALLWEHELHARLSLRVCYRSWSELPPGVDLDRRVDVLPAVWGRPAVVVCRGDRGGLWFLGLSGNRCPGQPHILAGFASSAKVREAMAEAMAEEG